MKQFFTVVYYELLSHLKNKVYRLSTIFVSLILIVGLSFPTIMNIIDNKTDSNNAEISEVETNEDGNVYGLTGNYLLVDQNNVLSEELILSLNSEECVIEKVTNRDEAETLLVDEDKDFEAIFVVESVSSYQYIVENKTFSISSYDETPYIFESILSYVYQTTQFEELGIDYTAVSSVMNNVIEREEIVLKEDKENNYVSTYILIFVLYMMVLLYGQNIAVSVASEKSNRAIEVLVTSANSNALIFGKVIAGAIASVAQIAVIVVSATATYQFNREAWNQGLDFIFRIPMDVLLTFGVFGILGYLFYSFIYGALGALVQKSEEVNSSSLPITIVYVIAFMVTYMGMMSNADGMLMKVASYLPFSSFMAMFTRLSMGSSISYLEVFISLIILVVSSAFVGILASKIYRMGTLMYGNKIKITDALKQLRNDK